MSNEILWWGRYFFWLNKLCLCLFISHFPYISMLKKSHSNVDEFRSNILSHKWFLCMHEQKRRFFFGEKKPRQMTKSFFEISARFLESIACKKKYFVLHCHYVHASKSFHFANHFFSCCTFGLVMTKTDFLGLSKKRRSFLLLL